MFDYQDKLVYVYFELDKQRGITTLFSISVYQDLTFDIFIRGKRLPCKHVSHLVEDKILDACTLTNILAFVKAMAEKTSKQPSYDINELIEDLTHTVEVNTALDQTTVGKLLFLIE